MAKNEVMSLLLQAEMDLDDVRELSDAELATVSGGIAVAGRPGGRVLADNGACDTGCNRSCGHSVE
jgi:bacteriocin-like protein